MKCLKKEINKIDNIEFDLINDEFFKKAHLKYFGNNNWYHWLVFSRINNDFVTYIYWGIRDEQNEQRRQRSKI